MIRALCLSFSFAACAAAQPQVISNMPSPNTVQNHEHPGHGHREGQRHGEGQPHEAHAMHHRFDHAETWAQRFDDPARDAWQKPEDVLAWMKLSPNAKVADIGAGTGYFSMRLARVLPQGRVFAVDLEPDMVGYLTKRAAQEGLGNVTPILATESRTNLAEPVDWVLMVDTYHHIEDRPQYFRALLPFLAQGAKVGIIDYTKEAPIGPPMDHRMSPEQVERELGASGLVLAEPIHFLPNQYFMIFAKR